MAWTIDHIRSGDLTSNVWHRSREMNLMPSTLIWYIPVIISNVLHTRSNVSTSMRGWCYLKVWQLYSYSLMNYIPNNKGYRMELPAVCTKQQSRHNGFVHVMHKCNWVLVIWRHYKIALVIFRLSGNNSLSGGTWVSWIVKNALNIATIFEVYSFCRFVVL